MFNCSFIIFTPGLSNQLILPAPDKHFLNSISFPPLPVMNRLVVSPSSSRILGYESPGPWREFHLPDRKIILFYSTDERLLLVDLFGPILLTLLTTRLCHELLKWIQIR